MDVAPLDIPAGILLRLTKTSFLEFNSLSQAPYQGGLPTNE